MTGKNTDDLVDSGIELNNSGNFEEAIKCFAKAAQLKPDNVVAFNNWGTALYNSAKIKQDESLFRESFEKYAKAAQIQPDNDFTFFNWGTALCYLAEIKQDESLFRESCEKYAKATQIQPDNAFAFCNWGVALCNLAKIEQNEALYKEACEKHAKAAQKLPDYAFVLNNWGIALSDLAKIKHDETLFIESFEKYAKATQIQPDNTLAFCNWGAALYYLAKIKQDKPLFREASECFKNSKMDILNILVCFDDKTDVEYIVQTDILYPLLDSDTDDGRFFKEVTKSIKDKLELDKYKRAYILSIFIISQLHVNNKNEEFVAHYREKTVSQEMLFNDSKFRLNAINYSNDPTEGKILFDYFFKEEKRFTNESLNREYGAFAGCFIFNYDSLNQFRLYGKEDGRDEGTGLSLVFRNSFFSKEAKMAIKQLKTEDGNTDREEEKHALFRCIYIDPETQRVETVGQKEAYLFYRGKKKEKKDKDIEVKITSYRKYIAGIVENIEKEMGNLKELVRDLDPAIVGQLLINLRYLTKHIAFKEEQECRIVKIYHLNDEKIKINTSANFKQMYVEYKPKVSNHIEKIIFGPKAVGMELFQDILTHKRLNIPCVKSKNPLA